MPIYTLRFFGFIEREGQNEKSCRVFGALFMCTLQNHADESSCVLTGLYFLHHIWGYAYNIPHSFSCCHDKISGILWTPIRYFTLHYRDRRSTSSLRDRHRTDIDQRSSMYVWNGALSCNGFRVGAKAVRFYGNTALIFFKFIHPCLLLYLLWYSYLLPMLWAVIFASHSFCW